MVALCKVRSSKLGKGTQQTSVPLKGHFITVHGAIAKRDSANTPKRWKPRRPHNVWRGKHAATSVRRSIPVDAGRHVRTAGATSDVDGFFGELGSKGQRTRSQSVRRADWTSRLMVESGAHVFTRCEEPLNRPATGRLFLRKAAERWWSRTSAGCL